MDNKCVCCDAIIPEGRQVCPSCENKKLIYADDLFAVLRDDINISGSNLAKVRRHIAETPAVDAVEVVHGRWEDEYGGKYANPRYRCSVCKERALYKFERDMLDNWKEVQALTPNCPYCAARLDGERKDNEEKVD